MRWLHIYLSMFGLTILLFFSVTGVTLNHPDWFFDQAGRNEQFEGDLDPAWLRRGPSDSVGGSRSDSSPDPEPGAESETSGELADADPEDDAIDGVSRLEVVEALRARHGIRGALVDFRIDETECSVSFKGPGYAADAFIDRDSGHYSLSETAYGAVAILNDLHKGRDSGLAWSVVIDVSAILMTVASLSGLVLLFQLKRRRMPGLVVGLLGTIVVVAIFVRWVP
jgi:hypothetical protein